MYHAGFHDGHRHDGYGHGYHGSTSGHVHPGMNVHVYGPNVQGVAIQGYATAPNTPVVVQFSGGDFHPFLVPTPGQYAPVIIPAPDPPPLRFPAYAVPHT